MKILPTYCDLTYSYCGKSFFSIVFICCILSLSTLAEPQLMLPETSVATSDGALASFFNPAGLGHNHTIDFYYLRTYIPVYKKAIYIGTEILLAKRSGRNLKPRAPFFTFEI